MGLLTVLLAASLHAGPAVSLETPTFRVVGEPYVVTLRLEAPATGITKIPNWALGPSAFTLDDKPLEDRPLLEEGQREPMIRMVPGQVIETVLDLGPSLKAMKRIEGTRDRTLAYEGVPGIASRVITSFEPAETGIRFDELPEPQLKDYQVLMLTTQGDLWFELWPDVAPNHVRNFLDLCYTGFYDGSGFHRVIPGFVAQGGKAKPGTTAPRRLKAEFNSRRHLRGVLSAARLPNDIDSAESEFFIMHAETPSLDGKYTPYGQLITGIEAVDRLVETRDKRYPYTTPKGFTPTTPQLIERAIVVKARPKPDATDGEDR